MTRPRFGRLLAQVRGPRPEIIACLLCPDVGRPTLARAALCSTPEEISFARRVLEAWDELDEARLAGIDRRLDELAVELEQDS